MNSIKNALRKKTVIQHCSRDRVSIRRQSTEIPFSETISDDYYVRAHLKSACDKPGMLPMKSVEIGSSKNLPIK